jgi:hypothetical protein
MIRGILRWSIRRLVYSSVEFCSIMARFNPSIGCRVKWYTIDIGQTDNWYQGYVKSVYVPHSK